MRILVVAETPEKFAAWERTSSRRRLLRRSRRGARRGDVQRDDLRAVPRHRTAPDDGARFAPDLTHLAVADDPRRRRARRTRPRISRAGSQDPQAIKPGCHMPDPQLTDAQVGDLVAYLETLR